MLIISPSLLEKNKSPSTNIMKLSLLFLLPVASLAFAPDASVVVHPHRGGDIALRSELDDAADNIVENTEKYVGKVDDLVLNRAMRVVDHAPAFYTLKALADAGGISATLSGITSNPEAFTGLGTALSVPTVSFNVWAAICAIQALSLAKSALANDENEQERDERDPPLSAAEAHNFRGCGGTVQFISGDRLDIKFAAKEAMPDAGAPRKSSQTKVKRNGRYLRRAPRFVLRYRWQKPSHTLVMGADASHAGCRRTRKSTSGVLGRIGKHLVHASSSTQSTVRLSSGEAEYAALVRATAEGLYIRAVLRFMWREVMIALESDSTAAIGTVRRF